MKQKKKNRNSSILAEKQQTHESARAISPNARDDRKKGKLNNVTTIDAYVYPLRRASRSNKNSRRRWKLHPDTCRQRKKNPSRSYSLSHVSRAWRRTRLQSNIECCVRGLIDLRQYFVLFPSLLRTFFKKIPLACLQRNDARLIRRFEIIGDSSLELRRNGANDIQLAGLIRCNTSEAERAKKERERERENDAQQRLVNGSSLCQLSKLVKSVFELDARLQGWPASLVSVKESACRYTERDGDGASVFGVSV